MVSLNDVTVSGAINKCVDYITCLTNGSVGRGFFFKLKCTFWLSFSCKPDKGFRDFFPVLTKLILHTLMRPVGKITYE